MSKAEQEHKSRVAALGCILCKHMGYGFTQAYLHHPRFSEGMGQRASDFLVIPLCYEHHQGATGLHGLGTREFERRYKLTEPMLLAMTIEALYK